MYIDYVPSYDGPIMKKGEIFNEAAFLLVCYHLTIFANLAWLTGNVEKLYLGYSLIMCVLLVIIVTTAIVLIEDILAIKHWLRLRTLKRKMAQFMTERDNAVKQLKKYAELN